MDQERLNTAHAALDREINHLEHHSRDAAFIAECGGQAAYDARYSLVFDHFMALDMNVYTDAEVEAAVLYAEQVLTF